MVRAFVRFNRKREEEKQRCLPTPLTVTLEQQDVFASTDNQENAFKRSALQ